MTKKRYPLVAMLLRKSRAPWKTNGIPLVAYAGAER